MAVVFTYGATVCTFQNDPARGNYTIDRQWMNPQTASGSGDTFIYDKSLVRDFETLTWDIMIVADVANLLAFLDAVDGAANPFFYTSVSGSTRFAYIWNADEIRSYPIQILLEGMTIELFVLPGFYMYDTVGLTDAMIRALAFARTIPDSIYLSDRFQYQFNGAWIQNPSDTITLSDGKAYSQAKTRSETISMSDSLVSMALINEAYITDNAGTYITDNSGNKIIATG